MCFDVGLPSVLTDLGSVECVLMKNSLLCNPSVNTNDYLGSGLSFGGDEGMRFALSKLFPAVEALKENPLQC